MICSRDQDWGADDQSSRLIDPGRLFRRMRLQATLQVSVQPAQAALILKHSRKYHAGSNSCDNTAKPTAISGAAAPPVHPPRFNVFLIRVRDFATFGIAQQILSFWEYKPPRRNLRVAFFLRIADTIGPSPQQAPRVLNFQNYFPCGGRIYD